MKEKELIERDYYINSNGEVFDNSLNSNNEDCWLDESEEKIKEIFERQDKEIKEVLK